MSVPLRTDYTLKMAAGLVLQFGIDESRITYKYNSQYRRRSTSYEGGTEYYGTYLPRYSAKSSFHIWSSDEAHRADKSG